MICHSCGAEIQGGKFCSECGAPISREESTKQEVDISARLGADKYYKKDEKIINAALRHRVLSEPEKVIIYAGNYYSNLDSHFLFVTTDELIFCQINDKKPERDIIKKFSYLDNRLNDFYDKGWKKIKIDESLIGFKPGKIIVYPGHLETIYREVQRLRGIDIPILKSTVNNTAPKNYKNGISPDELNYGDIIGLFGKDKIGAIKYVREYTGCDLKEAKEYIDRAYANTSSVPAYKAPAPVGSALSKKDRIKENKANGVACCPKCGSTSLSANKKGFGVGKAAVGVFTVGVLGAAAGGIGSGKVVITCLNCGHRWKV